MDYIFRFKKEQMEHGWTLRPKIKIFLSHEQKFKNMAAILDTGSDLNYIPQEIAEYFNLNLSQKTYAAHGAEHDFEYKTSKIYIKLDHPHYPKRKLIDVIVPVKNPVHNEVILGTDFLKEFIVTLDYGKGTIKLSDNKAK